MFGGTLSQHQTSRRDLWTESFSPNEEPSPHVKPVLQAHASHGDLTGPSGLLPSEVLSERSSLPLDLLLETLQEHAVVVHHRDVVQVVRLPASDGPEGLVNTLDIFLLARKYYSWSVNFKYSARFVDFFTFYTIRSLKTTKQNIKDH